MKRPPANLAASVRQRLYNLAKSRNVDFQRLLTQYALERLLFRISCSEYADKFIIKGAILFLVWVGEPLRMTRDLDLLGYGEPDPTGMVHAFQLICGLEVTADGMSFDAGSVSAKSIREDNVYGGIRVTLTARLENARIPIQVDIGFGDITVPSPQEIEFPTLFDFPAPRVRAYARETAIAEKVSALIVLGQDNSRMKDYFDLWFLSTRFGFAGSSLQEALAATLFRRRIRVPDNIPSGLAEEFSNDPNKQTQWRAFVRQSLSTELSGITLSVVVTQLRSFLLPVLDATRQVASFGGAWPPGGPWSIC